MKKRIPKKAKKAMKKVGGKSAAKATNAPEWKPSIYLVDKQVPKSLKDAKPGAKVEFTAVGKLVSKSEHLGDGMTVTIELDKMNANPKKGK